jgi:hypothetical protein
MCVPLLSARSVVTQLISGRWQLDLFLLTTIVFSFCWSSTSLVLKMVLETQIVTLFSWILTSSPLPLPSPGHSSLQTFPKLRYASRAVIIPCLRGSCACDVAAIWAIVFNLIRMFDDWSAVVPQHLGCVEFVLLWVSWGAIFFVKSWTALTELYFIFQGLLLQTQVNTRGPLRSTTHDLCHE